MDLLRSRFAQHATIASDTKKEYAKDESDSSADEHSEHGCIKEVDIAKISNCRRHVQRRSGTVVLEHAYSKHIISYSFDFLIIFISKLILKINALVASWTTYAVLLDFSIIVFMEGEHIDSTLHGAMGMVNS